MKEEAGRQSNAPGSGEDHWLSFLNIFSTWPLPLQIASWSSLLHAKLLQSCPVLCDTWAVAHQAILSWNSPSKNTGVAAVPSPGIFPTQGSNPCILRFLHWQASSLALAPPRMSPSLSHTIFFSLVFAWVSWLPPMHDFSKKINLCIYVSPITCLSISFTGLLLFLCLPPQLALF